MARRSLLKQPLRLSLNKQLVQVLNGFGVMVSSKNEYYHCSSLDRNLLNQGMNGGSAIRISKTIMWPY